MRNLTCALLLAALVWPAAARADGAKYLIITPDSYEDAVRPLAEWKTRKGVPARIVTMSEAGYSTVEINQYITDAVASWDPAPEFVLLVGNDVPMGWAGNAQSDIPYGNIDGDMFVEIHPGRFPADASYDVETMVEKTLQYERYPTTDEDYYRGAALLIHEDNDDDDWLHYFGDAAWEAGLMTASGFDDVDILSMTFTPNPTGAFEDLMEEGVAYAAYHGQIGGTVGWAGYNVTPSQIDNGPMLPVLVSYTCATTTGGGQWMRAGTASEPRGGVAFVGQTLSCSHCAMWRSALRRGFWGYVFEDTGEHEICTFAEAAEAARQQYYEEFHLPDQYNASTVLGDPELELWTRVPVEVEVSHPPVVPRGPITLEIQVTEQGAARDGIRVCVMSDEGSYAYATTDATGAVTFALDTTIDTTLYVTATGRNVRPYEAEMDVAGEAEDPGDDDDDDDDDVTGDDDDDVTDDDDDIDDDDSDHYTDPYDTDSPAGVNGNCATDPRRAPSPLALLSLTALAALALRRR